MTIQASIIRPPNPKGDRSAGFYIELHIFNWILIDSGLKLLLYGTPNPKTNITWTLDLELISSGLEILEIEIFNVPYNVGNIGALIFSSQSHPRNIGKQMFPIFSHPGNIGKRIFSIFSYPRNIGNRIF